MTPGGLSVVIATPTYDGKVSTGYVMALSETQELLGEAGISSAWLTCAGHSLIPRARNILAEQFLNDTSATHALLVDADILWRAEDVLRMLRHRHDFVAG